MKYEMKLFGTLSLVAGLCVAAPACGDRSTGGSETSESSSGTGDSGASEDTGDWSSDTSTDASDTDDATATDSETTAGFVTDTGSDTTETGTGPQPNGSPCDSGEECESEICYQIPMFGGVCSECETDQDCMDSREGLNCSLGQIGYAECLDGGLGTMCMSDESCEGDLVCAQVIDLGGIFNDQFCSECKIDGDCPDGQLCTPQFDLTAFTGQRSCADPGTVAQDGLCDIDEQCAPGFCGEVSLMGFLTLGACGECLTDGDCDMGTCMEGSVDLMGGGVTGPTCG